MPSKIFSIPDWPAPVSVKSAVTYRLGGHSSTPYESFNLAVHVGDDLHSVLSNRQLLANQLNIPDVYWMTQVHGTEAIYVDTKSPVAASEADACWTKQGGLACAVLTADCLPILVCDTNGTQVAAIHAGWRGLLHGVISKTLTKMNLEMSEVLVWLGPAIGPLAYQVGEDVRSAYVKSDIFGDLDLASAFVPDKPGHYLCDLYQLARMELASLGISQVYGGDQCTYTQLDRYFSYRRDGQTGRMASLIWLA